MITEKYPVFLIGAGRSGTKFLRACLSASEEVDSLPYDINYIWRYGNENRVDDELALEDIDSKIKQYIVKNLPRLATKNKSRAKFIIEKSVSNSLRVSFINDIFPNSKFIHIRRDGRAVIESSIRQWKQPSNTRYLVEKLKYFPIKNYRYAVWFLSNLIKSKTTAQPAIWGPRYKGLNEDLLALGVEAVAAKQWSRCVDLADSQLDGLDKSRVLKISFEDLVGDPQLIKELCRFIGITDIEKVERYFQDNVVKSNNKKSIENLSPDGLTAINDYALASLKRLGYL